MTGMYTPWKRWALGGLGAAALLAGSVAAAAPASATPLPGLQLVTSTSPTTTGHTLSHSAQCPRSKVALSGGAFLLGSNTVRIDMIRPTSTGKVDVLVAGKPGYRPPWQVVVYAVCANRPPGLEYVSGDSPAPSGLRLALATCPVGKKLIGFGGRAYNQPNRNAGMIAMYGLADNRALVAAQPAEGGEPNAFTARAYAVCADPQPGDVGVYEGGALDSSASKSTAADCPAGKKVHAVGFVAPSDEHVEHLIGLYPDAALDTGVSIAVEHPAGDPTTWGLDTYVLCY